MYTALLLTYFFSILPLKTSLNIVIIFVVLISVDEAQMNNMIDLMMSKIMRTFL